jgi:hypothetical protein
MEKDMLQLVDWMKRRADDEKICAINSETAHQQAHHLSREALLREIVIMVS